MQQHPVRSLPFGTANNIKWDGTGVNIQSPVLTQYTLNTEMDTLPLKSEGNQYFLLSLLGMMDDFKRGSARISTHLRWSPQHII
jgi:hypothetical protein